MAETYDTYLKNKNQSENQGLPGQQSIVDRLESAVSQTELLQDVRRRVEAFVKAYEHLNRFGFQEAAKIRSRDNPTERSLRIADAIEQQTQEIYTQGHKGSSEFTALTLDDLKILLDQFPQQ